MEYRNEQIMIDETECKDYDNGCCKGSCCLNSVSIVNSCEPQNTRCDFCVNKLEEQLARKTQECEEQEDKIKKLRKNLALEIEANYRYREALEAIEKECCAVLNGDEKILYAYKIKEIIDEIKGNK